MTYKIGDVVRLKSGGVPMCVTAYHPDVAVGGYSAREGSGTVSVTWLTTIGEPRSYAFDERLVEPYVWVPEGHGLSSAIVNPNSYPVMGDVPPIKAADGSITEYIDGNWVRTVDPKGYPMAGDAGSAQFCSKCGKVFSDDKPITGCSEPECTIGFHPPLYGRITP